MNSQNIKFNSFVEDFHAAATSGVNLGIFHSFSQPHQHNMAVAQLTETEELNRTLAFSGCTLLTTPLNVHEVIESLGRVRFPVTSNAPGCKQVVAMYWDTLEEKQRLVPMLNKLDDQHSFYMNRYAHLTHDCDLLSWFLAPYVSDNRVSLLLARLFRSTVVDPAFLRWEAAVELSKFGAVPQAEPSSVVMPRSRASHSSPCAPERPKAGSCALCSENLNGSQWIQGACENDCHYHYDCLKFANVVGMTTCKCLSPINYVNMVQRSRRAKPKAITFGKCKCVLKHVCYNRDLIVGRNIDFAKILEDADERVFASSGVELRAKRPPIRQLKGFGTNSRFATKESREKAAEEGQTVSLEKFQSLQKQLRDVRREANDLAQYVRVEAASESDSFTFTGKSRYLRSVLLPDEGAVSVPDDVVRLHHVKSETVTYNLTVPTSGSGLLFLYPNHPTNLVGFHYVMDDMGLWNFDTAIYTAQDLRDSYDFAKRSAQLLTVRSSTLPSGVYALNGTFNAVRVDGFISEIPGLSLPDLYNTILTNTVEPLDKIGNVLVGDGLAVLSMLDAFGQPYTRLGDITPSTSSTGAVLTPPYITDRSSDLQYTAVNSYALPVPGLTNTTVADLTFNIDSNTGVSILTTFTIANTADLTGTVSLTYDFLGPFGSVIYSETVSSQLETSSAVGQINFSKFFPLGTQPGGVSLGALCALRVTNVFYGSSATGDNPSLLLQTDITATVPTGARSGINGPINVVAYQGVAAGSVLTLSGWTNFELVPNPALRQNLPVKYGEFDSRDASWCKTVLGHRSKFELRSIWNLKDYQSQRGLLAELADVNVHDRAQAMSFSNIVKGLKSTFAPIGKRILDSAVSGVVKGMAASGSAIAASGNVVRVRADSSSGVKQLELPPQRTLGERVFAMDRRIPTKALMQRSVKKADNRFVAFPVLRLREVGDPVVMLYVVTTVPLQPSFGMNYRARLSGHFVQGYDDKINVNIDRDLWLSPIDFEMFAQGKLKPIVGPIVSGRSLDGALYLACYGKRQGLYPFAITGELENENLLAHESFLLKLEGCHQHGVALAGNSSDADLLVVNIAEVGKEAPQVVVRVA